MGVIVILMTLFCWIMKYPLVLSLFLLYLGLHLISSQKLGYKILIDLGLLVTLCIFVCHIAFYYTSIAPFYTPIAAFSMLAMLLFNNLHVTFMMAVATSVFAGVILGGSFSTMIIFFLGSLTGAYSVRNARTRGQLFAAGLFVSLIQVVCLILLYPQLDLFITRNFLFDKLYPLAVNGLIATLTVAATLKIFEYLFGVLTNFSLLELSDFNHPLLKRMIMEAPGTYHHSLVVSNLAEAAANAIEANALLTRVGAYYHDIGKLSRSQYFTENQLVEGNAHDKIEPSMSRLVILNHVTEGVELAKKYKLNQAIIDFIPQHHGTSIIHYFHQRAVEAAEDGEEVKEENFRYPGPKPQTRETAITLLADSVEGATRALDEHTPANIEETVKKVINNKFIDGQLDECNLTLKEIEKISATFVRILTAMYHTRIKYPEKKNGNSSRKSSFNDSAQHSTNPENHQGHSSS